MHARKSLPVGGCTIERTMERVSAKRMLLPTPLSKLAQFKVFQGQSLYGANRKPIDDLQSDLL